MKKVITSTLLVLFCCIGMAAHAATITLAPTSSAPPNSIATIDGSNNVTLASGSASLQQIIYFSNVPSPHYWYETVPGYGAYTFFSNYAHTLVVQWFVYDTFETITTIYQITY